MLSRLQHYPVVTFLAAVVVSMAILAAGWIPARLMVSTWQQREGLQNLHGARLASPAYYEERGVDLPMWLTAFGVLVCSAVALDVFFRSRRFKFVCAYLAFLIAWALVWMFAFMSISFDAFD